MSRWRCLPPSSDTLTAQCVRCSEVEEDELLYAEVELESLLSRLAGGIEGIRATFLPGWIWPCSIKPLVGLIFDVATGGFEMHVLV